MSRFAILLYALLLCAACSSRIVYETRGETPNANAVNINTATAYELEQLPHVGHATAQAIIEFRTSNGPFSRAEDIMLIRGFSEKRFAELRPLIRTR